MAETIGGDIGLQILQAVQGLGVRMDRLEARMDRLEARVDGLETQVKGLGVRMDRLEARVDGLETQVKGLGVRMDGLETQVKDLGVRMQKQESWMERLGAEFINSREGLRDDVQKLRTEMHEGFRQLKARIELTEEVVVLMASELRRPRELGQDLEKRLRELETH